MAKKTTKKVSKPVKKAVAKKVTLKKVIKKAALKKAAKPVKKVIVKKAAPKKTSRSIKKIAAKRVVAKKPATKKVAKPIKKAIAKKGAPKKVVKPTKRVTIKKTTPKKAAKPVKKAIAKKRMAKKVAKKIEVKKVVPAKQIAKVLLKKAAIIAKPVEVVKAVVTSAKKPEPMSKPTVFAQKQIPIAKLPIIIRSKEVVKYSDKDLVEFRALILKKLDSAKIDFELLKDTLSHKDNNGTDDTSPTFKLLEDGSDIMSKEETAQLAIRQQKFILNLENALIRIENKTYGICRETGRLISKERLRSVPHATLSIEAKKAQP